MSAICRPHRNIAPRVLSARRAARPTTRSAVSRALAHAICAGLCQQPSAEQSGREVRSPRRLYLPGSNMLSHCSLLRGWQRGAPQPLLVAAPEQLLPRGTQWPHGRESSLGGIWLGDWASNASHEGGPPAVLDSPQLHVNASSEGGQRERALVRAVCVPCSETSNVAAVNLAQSLQKIECRELIVEDFSGEARQSNKHLSVRLCAVTSCLCNQRSAQSVACASRRAFWRHACKLGLWCLKSTGLLGDSHPEPTLMRRSGATCALPKQSLAHGSTESPRRIAPG